MPQTLKSLLICAVLGPCILFQPGCTNSADSAGAWDLKDEIPDMPLLPGVYQAEFEVINDGCEPSLHDIFNKVEEWPPPLVFIHYYDEAAYNQLLIPLFRWRDGEFDVSYTRTDENFLPYSEDFWNEEWPSLPAFNYLNCSIQALYAGPYRTRAEVSLIGPNTIEVLISSDWGDIQECVSEHAREVFKTIPRADCSESYKTTYRLVEACILPCGPPPHIGLTGGTMDGYRYLRYEDPPPSCICD